MLNEDKKAHLLYLTGLSIDKKRLNYITENINTDKDFSYWLKKVQTELSTVIENNKKYIQDQLQSNVNIISIISNAYIDEIFSNKDIKNFVTPILSDILDAKQATFNFNKKIDYNMSDILEDISNKSKKYKNANFFSLYLSHQSDSMIVSPLSKLSSYKNFNFINSYCDRPYYNNEYISHITLTIKKNLIEDVYKDIFKEFVESNFHTHILDIVLSKVIGEAESNGNTYLDIVEGGVSWKNLKDIQQSLSERNFFGITLLSQLIYNFEEVFKNEKFQINITNENKEKEEFLKELLISSGNPNNLEFTKNADIQADIFFSNGLENNESTEYFCEENEHFIIRVPIKMFLSLPIDKDEKVNSSLFVPYGIDSEVNDVVDIVTTGGAEHNRALAHLINKHRLEYKNKRIFGFMDNKFDVSNMIKNIRNFEYGESFLMGLNQPVSGFNTMFLSRVDDAEGESSNHNTKLLGFRLKANNKVYNILSLYGFSALASVYSMHHLVADMSKKSNFNTEQLEEYEKDEELLLTKGIFHSQYLSVLNRKMNMFDVENIKYVNKGLSATIGYDKNINAILNKNFNNKLHLFIFNTNIELYRDTFLNGTKESIIDSIQLGLTNLKNYDE